MRQHSTSQAPIGTSHHAAILSLLAILLLLRSLFYGVTVHERKDGQSLSSTAQYNEHLWYPLAALAELLACLCFLLPGLVPLRSLVAKHRHSMAAGRGEKGAYAGDEYNNTGAGGAPMAGDGYARDGAATGHNGMGRTAAPQAGYGNHNAAPGYTTGNPNTTAV